MPEDPQHIEQHAEGIGHAQAIGPSATAYSRTTVFNTPVDKFVSSLLQTTIALQLAGYFCAVPALTISADRSFAGLSLAYVYCCCFPLLFGPASLYGLFIGFQLRSRNIKYMAVVSGFLSLCVLLAITTPLFSLRVLGTVSKSLGLNEELIQAINGLINKIATPTPGAP